MAIAQLCVTEMTAHDAFIVGAVWGKVVFANCPLTSEDLILIKAEATLRFPAGPCEQHMGTNEQAVGDTLDHLMDALGTLLRTQRRGAAI